MIPKNWAESKIISVDIETHDPFLKEKGNGVYRKDGKILGIAFGFFLPNKKIETEYLSLAHYDTKEEIRNKNTELTKEILASPIRKLGANLLYDLDWIINGYGFKVDGALHDIQVAEPLIYEYRTSYSLDALSNFYLDRKKDERAIEDYARQNGFRGNVKTHLHRMPSFVVADYARVDAELPILIFEKQMAELEKQKLTEVYKLEMSLFPLLLKMRKIGVRIDNKELERSIFSVKNIMKKTNFDVKQNLPKKYVEKKNAGQTSFFFNEAEINFNSSRDLALLFDSLGLTYPWTNSDDPSKKSNPSITKEVLKKNENEPIIANILRYKKFDKTLNTFLLNSFTESQVGGRIHSEFYPLKTDQYGTISGRLSGANPNLQQIPSRDPEIQALCRKCFLPENDMMWGRLDWSQIEYRIFAHYAQGSRSNEIRDRYTSNDKTDYHDETQRLIGWPDTGEYRKLAKNLNFGLMYGMGTEKAMKFFGWTREYAENTLNLYHEKLPFVKKTMYAVGDEAKRKGFIRTLTGRKARLIEQGKEYRMFNRLIQGTAADVMKKAMSLAYEKNLFSVLVPHLTVHDELDVSVPRTKEGVEAFFELKNTMETCVKLKVPIIAEGEMGPNWYNLNSANTKDEIFLSMKI